MEPLSLLRDAAAMRVAACAACGAEFHAPLGHTHCPLCRQELLFTHINKLRDYMALLDSERASVQGQIQSLVKHLQDNSVAPPAGPSESWKCARCAGFLHLGYLQTEPHRYICEACALETHHAGEILRREACRHGVAIMMCEPCRRQHAHGIFVAKRRIADAERAASRRPPEPEPEEI